MVYPIRPIAFSFLSKTMLPFLVLLVMACRTGPGQVPDEGWGRVVKVIDGDTIDLLPGNKRTFRIRLSGIDAPERGMPFGKAAKDYLGRLCANQRIRYVKQDVDRYGRMVAKCYLQDGRHIESEMLRAGMAWHFTRYSTDQRLQKLEDEARAGRRGLWQDKYPQAPWDYRKTKYKKQ